GRILIFFGHFFSSVVQRVHIACIYSKCSGRAVIPTTLKAMNASLSAATYPDPNSEEFIATVKAWVDEHLSEIVEELTRLVTYKSLAFDGFDRQPLENSAAAVAQLLVQAGLDEIH